MSDGVKVVPTSGGSLSHAFLTIFGLGDVKVRKVIGFMIRSLIYKSYKLSTQGWRQHIAAADGQNY